LAADSVVGLNDGPSHSSSVAVISENDLQLLVPADAEHAAGHHASQPACRLTLLARNDLGIKITLWTFRDPRREPKSRTRRGIFSRYFVLLGT